VAIRSTLPIGIAIDDEKTMLRLILCALVVLYVPITHAVARADTAYIADLLYSAHARAQPFPDIMRINPALDDAELYAIQRRFVALRITAGDGIGGYKGGFIPRAPIGGVLFAGGHLTGAPVIERDRFQSLLVEAEIGFRLCGPRQTVPFADVAALRAATCAVFPAVELPDAAFADLASLRENFTHLRQLLIATNVAASHVLTGTERNPAEFDLDRLDVRVVHDGDEIGVRPGATSDDDIWQRLLWTVNKFVIANGYALEPEHVIIPGALTGLHAGKPGHYAVDYGALGRVEFEIR
jgi:2-oxo-hept-3-ene-1,7-dioate hydratase